MRTVLGSLKLSRSELTGLVHLDYHVWGDMLQKRHKLQPKTKTTDELKAALQSIWDELPQEHVNKAVANFIKRFTAYIAVAASGGHFEHLQ